MRKLNVRHEPLPGIGDRFELDTASGQTMIVIAHRSGRRDLAISDGGDVPDINVRLSKSQAIAVATLLLGAHMEFTTTHRS
jgi:K+/H+ antiporter YhaU regulatory subunit KhtT